MSDDILDLLIVGAGPTGIAIGAEARRAGLERVLLVDRGPLCAAIVQFPVGMIFFTTRDKLEIADIPFGIPDEKPTRRQALAYYQGVARRYQLDLALYEDVLEAQRRDDDTFAVQTRGRAGERIRRARAVALATGYFDLPVTLGVPGEDRPWVHRRYLEPYPHFGQHVLVVGGGNSACEAALDLWRNGARVTLVHRHSELKPSVKYWLKPDVENRLEEGSIAAFFDTEVEAFRDAPDGGGEAVLWRGGERLRVGVDAAYVLVGYLPDVELQRRCGVRVDPQTLVPAYDPETCESNVPGLYIAGTLQAGRDTGRIFIENSRDHGPRIVGHLLRRRSAAPSRSLVV